MSEREPPARTRVEVPEPRRAPLATGDEADEADLSTRAIPLDAAGAAGRWFRRHRIEVGIFVSVILLLTAATAVIMRDPGSSGTRDVTSVGPSPGQALEPYIAVRRRALEDAAVAGGERLGVVSFDRRLTADELAGLEIERPVVVEGVIVGVNDRELEVVEGRDSPESGIPPWIAGQLSRYENQLAGAGEQLAADPSPTPVADWFRAEEAAATQAIEMLTAGTVIEGLIVSGPVRDLVVVQQISGVVLVDLAPVGKRSDEVIPVLVGAGATGSG